MAEYPKFIYNDKKMSRLKYLKKECVLVIPIQLGDVMLTGRFRNKPIKVKEIGVDELGQPTINGKPILKFRLKNLM